MDSQFCREPDLPTNIHGGFMKRFVTIVAILGLILSVGCKKENTPTGPDTTVIDPYEGGGDAGANGTAELPSGHAAVPAADATEAQTTTQTANTSLETALSGTQADLYNLDVSEANTSYKAAIEKDPNNTQAQFGAAVTELVIANQKTNADDLMKDMFGDATFSLFGTGSVPLKLKAEKIKDAEEILMTMAEAEVKEIVKISDIQKAVKDSVLPKIAYALDRLSIIENDPDFVFTITPQMQGRETGESYELDLGEVYMIDACLRMIRGYLLVLISYNVDVDDNGSYAWIQSDSDSTIVAHLMRLHQSTTFLALNSYGSDAMKSAIKNFRTTIDKAKLGVAFVKAEVDDQMNDIIRKEFITDANAELLEEGMSITTITEMLDTIKSALEGPCTVPLTKEVSIRLNVSAVFDNPIQDLKSKFPYIKWKDPSTWEMKERYSYKGPNRGDYTQSCDLEGCTYTYTPGTGSYVSKRSLDGPPLDFVKSDGSTVITESELSKNGPDFPDYTLGGLFPDLTNKDKWKELIEKLDNSTTEYPMDPVARKIGFSLAKYVRQ